MKVSVLLPIYKTKTEYLKETIDSILSQTFEDFELLIVDDCPQDSRESFIKSYKDPRIKYVLNETNLGISHARNKLLDMAKGEYLAIMDHDDICMPTRFEKQVAYLDANPDVGVVGCMVEKFNNITCKIVKFPVENHEIKVALMRNSVILHPSSMIRKSVLEINNLKYNPELFPSEDYGLWCDLIPLTNFYNIPEVLFRYRKHEQSTLNLNQHKTNKVLAKIYAKTEVQNPIIYKEFLFRARTKTIYYLLGFIPFLTIIKKGERNKIYLFGKFLIFTSRTLSKL